MGTPDKLPTAGKLDAEEIMAVAIEWFRAFNKHDIEALLSLYADDAEHYSPKLQKHQPETQGWVKGKDQLREWWESAFERLPTLHYDVQQLRVEGNRVNMKYARQVDGEADMEVTEILEIREIQNTLRIVLSRITDQL